MVRFSIFSGHDGPLGPSGAVYVTIFAGSTLRRPPSATLAARVRAAGDLESHERCTCLTLFGGVDILWPTMAEEYVALREAVRSGALTLEDWDRYVAAHGSGGGVHVNSVTLFGSCNGDTVPSENRELEDLALHRHLGHIPDSAVQYLLTAVDQKGVVRFTAIRQAIAAGG